VNHAHPKTWSFHLLYNYEVIFRVSFAALAGTQIARQFDRLTLNHAQNPKNNTLRFPD
jgi:hypothetical protein